MQPERVEARLVKTATEKWKSQIGSKTLTGGNDGEVPPVPIPNTEVKLSSAESTWLDTAREDRSLPVPPYSSVAQWQSTRLLTGLL